MRQPAYIQIDAKARVQHLYPDCRRFSGPSREAVWPKDAFVWLLPTCIACLRDRRRKGRERRARAEA